MRNYPVIEIVKVPPITIDSVGSKMRLDEKATFDILIPSLVKGMEVISSFKVEVLLTPNLKPNILLSTMFLKANGLNIDYPSQTISSNVYLGLTFPFQAVTRRKPITRRVVAVTKIVVLV